MGAPWHLHRDRFAAACVVVRSSNYTLYGDMSRRVMRCYHQPRRVADPGFISLIEFASGEALMTFFDSDAGSQSLPRRTAVYRQESPCARRGRPTFQRSEEV
jgi:hypothetical protein